RSQRRRAAGRDRAEATEEAFPEVVHPRAALGGDGGDAEQGRECSGSHSRLHVVTPPLRSRVIAAEVSSLVRRLATVLFRPCSRCRWSPWTRICRCRPTPAPAMRALTSWPVRVWSSKRAG